MASYRRVVVVSSARSDFSIVSRPEQHTVATIRADARVAGPGGGTRTRQTAAMTARNVLYRSVRLGVRDRRKSDRAVCEGVHT